MTERFEDLVHAATYDTWAEVERLQDINIAEFQSLLANPNLVASAPAPPAEPEIASAKEKAPQVVFLGLAEEDDDATSSVEDDFELIVEAVEMSDGDVDGFFEMFYGDPDQVHELEDFVAARRNSGNWRQHAAPASAEVLEIVGDRRAECWCGADYGIREGCTNFYSIDFDE